jgi:hypothetical protein
MTALEMMPRSEFIALCKRLGHDPERVAHIRIDPGSVEVVYVHPIVDKVREMDGRAV